MSRGAIFFIQVSLACSLLSGCGSVPHNVGLSRSATEIGAVYAAKVKAIYPIYVGDSPGARSNARAAGDLAGALTEKLFSLTTNSTMAKVTSDAARNATGAYEDRYSGLFCHYILETEDLALQSLTRGNNAQSEEFSDNEEVSEVDSKNDGNNEKENASSVDGWWEVTNKSNVARRQISADKDYRMQEMWLRIEQNFSNWKGVTRVERDPNLAKGAHIYVVNPCRNLKIGSRVTISRGQGTVILQPSWY